MSEILEDAIEELARFDKFSYARSVLLLDHIADLETALRACLRHMKTAGSPEAVRACEAAEELIGGEDSYE